MSGYNIDTDIPIWAGRSWQYYSQQQAGGDPWSDALSGVSLGQLQAFYGFWAGAALFRWIWPHGTSVGIGGHTLLNYWDAVLGDGFIIDEPLFRNEYAGWLLFNPTHGVYTPY